MVLCTTVTTLTDLFPRSIGSPDSSRVVPSERRGVDGKRGSLNNTHVRDIAGLPRPLPTRRLEHHLPVHRGACATRLRVDSADSAVSVRRVPAAVTGPPRVPGVGAATTVQV